MSKDTKMYHLLFLEPTFLPHVVYWAVVQGSFLRMCVEIPEIRLFFDRRYAMMTEQMMFLSYQLSWWWIISLLASACCAFQLILNLFSVGCAGFNAVLGPARPFFIATAFVGQGGKLFSEWGKPGCPRAECKLGD